MTADRSGILIGFFAQMWWSRLVLHISKGISLTSRTPERLLGVCSSDPRLSPPFHLVCLSSCPESPRWYMKKHRIKDAWKVMKRIRQTELQAARDLYYAYLQFEAESKVSASNKCADISGYPGQASPNCSPSPVAGPQTLLRRLSCWPKNSAGSIPWPFTGMHLLDGHIAKLTVQLHYFCGRWLYCCSGTLRVHW